MELKQRLQPAGVGFAAEAIVARYFIVQYCCASIALPIPRFELAEWDYCGRPIKSLNLGLILGMLAAALAGGLWAQPQMNEWHIIKYFGKTVALQTQAGQNFARFHAVSETVNLLVVVCLVFYLWRVSAPPESPRFAGISKMRG